MKRVQRTVEIELSKDECQTLYNAEKLLKEMEREISAIATPVYANDLEKITNCLKYFCEITSRYSIHVKLGVEDDN